MGVNFACNHIWLGSKFKFLLIMQVLIIMTLSREVLECFRREELLDWSQFQATYSQSLRDGVSDGPATSVFTHDELGEKQWENLRKRIVEHVSEPTT